MDSMIYKISPSSLNLLEECPKCFWMYVVKKHGRPNGAFPSLPSGVDRLLKNRFDKFREIDELPPEIRHHKIDALLFKIIVLDYKTRGFPLKEDTAHHYQDQLNIYNFLLRKNGYHTEDYAYLLFFIPREIDENGGFIFNTELVKMKTNVDHAEELFQKAVEIVKGEMPESSEKCGFCEWTKQIPSLH